MFAERNTQWFENVYDQAPIDVIHNTKVFLDLPALAVKLRQSDGGSIKIPETDFPKFREAVYQYL